MREEDLDWQVYHLLLDDAGRDEDALAALLHCTPGEVHTSIGRLEKAMLLECTPGGVRVLSVQEMALRCQARYDRSCPFSIKGGVIRLKGGSDEKDD